MNSELLIIYVKTPILGHVKTRLAESIGEEKALYVYRKLLGISRDCISELPVDIIVSYGNEIDENDFWEGHNMFRSQQIEGTLGERMYADIEKGFSMGYEKVCLVGSDIPELTPSILNSAFEALEKKQIVLGPAYDGGYYLIGFQQQTQNRQLLFEEMEWSTPEVLKQTLKKARKNKLSYYLVEKLKDIDRLEDLNGYGFLLD